MNVIQRRCVSGARRRQRGRVSCSADDGAAATHAGLLSLPPELEYDAEAGSALEVLEVSHALARKALSLHKELLAEASSDAPPAGLLELLSTRLLWQEGGTDVPADTPDAPAAPARVRILRFHAGLGAFERM